VGSDANAGTGGSLMRDRLMSLLVRPTAPPLWLGIVVASALIAVEALVVRLLQHVTSENIFGAVFLFGVLIVSAGWGFGLAVMTTLASALVYVYFHLDGDGSYLPTQVKDWVAILVFLPLALLANLLAGQARLRTAEANQRRREAEESRDANRVLADQQASLRRIATLVARAVPPSEVFTAVAEEMARCLGVDHATVERYESDGAATVVAAYGADGARHMEVGKRLSFRGDSVAALVRHTGRIGRRDMGADEDDPDAKYITELGLRSGVGAPIIVAGQLWGAAVVASFRPDPLPPDTEARVADFADLVATALANAQARAELTASRARIVTAFDAARRRVERDLHDGAQQRLVSLGLQLRTAEAAIPPELHSVKEQISDLVAGVTAVSNELQEISRGIHPAILTRGGLGPALKALARRSAIPVELHLGAERRLPESVEVAAYYVVAEALTNAAKHSQACVVEVGVSCEATNLQVSVEDDGIGGADSHKGSGLIGLVDRVEALGGQLKISSLDGQGTSLHAVIPFETA
jgi:signal transduction histidine kinase